MFYVLFNQLKMYMFNVGCVWQRPHAT